MTTYTLYIDESGETGIAKVRTKDKGGASPYMTLGAVLIPDHIHDRVVGRLDVIAKRMGKGNLHCSSLKHHHKVFYAREIAKERMLCFGVISLKETLGSYKAEIESEGTKYFNKCSQYLLERVGAFMKQYDIPAGSLKIIFEKGHHDYARFRAFITKCQNNPIRENTRLLEHIKISNITDAPKDREPMLQVADLIAHSLFKAVDKTEGNYYVPEPRYLNEIHKSFYCDENSKDVVGHGIMVVHTLKQLKLDDDVHTLMESFKGIK